MPAHILRRHRVVHAKTRPCRTWSTSPPTSSQKRAGSFMKLIRAASIAFAAYFVSAADGMDIDSIRFSRIVNRKNSSFRSSNAKHFFDPIFPYSAI